MKVLQINHSYKYGGSTGRIVYELQELSENLKIDSYVAFGYDFNNVKGKNLFKICSIPQMQISKLQTRFFGEHGFYNTKETYELIKHIKRIKPDVIHLHNLHNHYLNSQILFDYIKEEDIPIVWTLHDCWSFTGWCAYFDYANCSKWESECNECPSLKDYPFTWFFDKSKPNFYRKKKAFTEVKNLIIVTPSIWLSEVVKRSFLSDYPVKVINNGIDLNIFSPKLNNSLRQRHNLIGKKVILSVASEFDRRKGLDFLVKLPEFLEEDEVLLLVGLKSNQKKLFSNRKCICIERTESVKELAEYYSLADVFLNTTLEDNFPTTNLEALACGTPVITFDSGGSIEAVDNYTGKIVAKGDLTGLLDAKSQIFRKRERGIH